MTRIVLAYSGGLDTSVAIAWLKARHEAEIVTVTMDLGQGRNLESVRDRALAIGASRAHVLDLRDEFARDFVVPSLKADALYDDRSPMAPSLGRPLIAKKLVEIARIEGTAQVAHGGGAEGKPAALDVLLRALAPDVTVIAPARSWGMSRPEVADFARAHGIAVPSTVDSPWRANGNLWGRSIEWTTAEDLLREPPEGIYTLTRPAHECPDEAAYVELAFEAGVPAAINGVALPLLELIASLGTIAAAHGVGRIDVVEHRVAGTPVHEAAEAPAAVLLHAAHKELRKASASRPFERFWRTVSAEYADIIATGQWFTPLRQALDGFVAAAQDRVTGVVRLKLFKGSYSIVGRNAVASAAAGRAVLLPMAKH